MGPLVDPKSYPRVQPRSREVVGWHQPRLIGLALSALLGATKGHSVSYEFLVQASGLTLVASKSLSGQNVTLTGS